MKSTRIVKQILSHYEGETPGVKANLNRMLMTGKLGGTGRMIRALNTVLRVVLRQILKATTRIIITSLPLMQV